MDHPPDRLYGWGYAGHSVDDLVAFAQTHGVHAVVDVRLNPVSRKRGFSKRLLAAALEDAGLAYVHLPALGNPRDNRDAFAAPGTAAGRAAHARYSEEVLDADAGQDALRELTAMMNRGPVALLCYEADQVCCHRHLVIRAVAELVEPVLV